MRREHIDDPFELALQPDGSGRDHALVCSSCAMRVRSARRLLDQVRSAVRPEIEGLRLPDGAFIRTLVRRRRAARRCRRLAAAAIFVLALALGGNVARDRHQRSVDLADDALLRSIRTYETTPDIGGLGQLVRGGIDVSEAAAGQGRRG